MGLSSPPSHTSCSSNLKEVKHTTTTEGRGIKPRPSLFLGQSPRRSLREGAYSEVQHHEQPTTIAILGCDTVVGRSLSVLLEGSGYETTLLDAYPTGVVDELLEGADLLILTPRVDEGVREAFLGAMGKSTPQKAEIPVIALSTTATEENLPEKEGVISVPWPCETKILVDHIEAALLDVPAASSSPTNQAGTG